MGQWDDLKTGSVAKGLRKGLSGGNTLSHSATVDIIRSTLSNGIVSKDELDDLKYVATESRTMPPRSKSLVLKFVELVTSTVGGMGPYRLPTDRHEFAAEMVCDFLQRSGQPYFPMLNRDDVGLGLLMRLAKPSLMDQKEGSLCGPINLLFNLATDKPVDYAAYARDLYEQGKAKLGRVLIEPGKDVRNYNPGSKVPPVDWLTAASLRDSENWFLDYDTADKAFAGITLPGELASWFSRAGYSDVQEEANLYFNKGSGNIEDANRLYSGGYRVCMFINAQMLDAVGQTKSSTLPDHWVVLRSPIYVKKDPFGMGNDTVSATVFTWADGHREIPRGKELSLNDFNGNYYGFVAAKP